MHVPRQSLEGVAMAEEPAFDPVYTPHPCILQPLHSLKYSNTLSSHFIMGHPLKPTAFISLSSQSSPSMHLNHLRMLHFHHQHS